MRSWVIGCAVLTAAVAAVVARRAGVPESALERVPAAARPSASPLSQEGPSSGSSRAPGRGREEFVGSAVCASCHRAQSEVYRGSHHAKALVVPSAQMAEARFDGETFSSKLGGKTHFSLRDGGPVVTTASANGKTETFPIAYVSGVWPIEQYVVATERGKLQALGVAWDSRSPEQGGSKWFHVYGANGIAPADALHFTSPAQNWNHMCADCHSTRVERRYDTAADRFDTHWTELSVGCEACHGPGAEHVRAARAGNRADAVASLAVRLRSSEPWSPSASGSPAPRLQNGIEVEVCAPCHSRREPLEEGFLASDPFLDSFEPELLLAGSYHADGQVEGEVYEWGSFLQSRMHQAGVQCSDCHDPHSGKLLSEGNTLCLRCHEPARFAVPAHSQHAAGGQSPLCIDCHMPPATFMQIDERRDHSIRIPRPDHSVEFGTPNACNVACHTKESPAWASASIAKWFPASHARPHFVDALAKDRRGSLDAARALRNLAESSTSPAIARATALQRLGRYPADQTGQTLKVAIASPEPLVAFGAVLGAAELPLQQRADLLVPALQHPIRAVRVAAAKALAGMRSADLPARARGPLDRAFAEVKRSFELNASRAETHVERSAFELARAKPDAAEASIRTALRLQPCLAEAYLNLADLERQRRDESAAERAIRSALDCDPRSAAAHHALGLWQIRARELEAALISLKQAVTLAPTEPRFSYVLAVALAEAGRRDEAIGVLEAMLDSRPNDAGALQALEAYLRQAGRSARAAEVRRILDQLSKP